LGVQIGAISKVISKFQKYGDINHNLHKENGGRRPILSETEKDLLRDSLRSDSTLTLSELVEIIKAENQKAISKSAVSKYLNEIGRYRFPMSIQILSERNREKRLNMQLSIEMIHSQM